MGQVNLGLRRVLCDHYYSGSLPNVHKDCQLCDQRICVYNFWPILQTMEG